MVVGGGEVKNKNHQTGFVEKCLKERHIQTDTILFTNKHNEQKEPNGPLKAVTLNGLYKGPLLALIRKKPVSNHPTVVAWFSGSQGRAAILEVQSHSALQFGCLKR